MKYRDANSTQQLSMLLRELAMIDSYFRQCDMELELSRVDPLDAVEQVDVLMQAALNHRGQQ